MATLQLEVHILQGRIADHEKRFASYGIKSRASSEATSEWEDAGHGHKGPENLLSKVGKGLGF